MCCREPEDFSVRTQNVDDEIARIAGPQLVVPVSNARYALNAANARWGSLYDALYGTDAIPEEDGAARSGGYNKARGAKVVARAREVLDQAAPLAGGSHGMRLLMRIEDGALLVTLQDGTRDGPAATRPSSSAISGEAASPRPCSCATTTCIWTSGSTARIRSAPRIRPALPTWCWRSAISTIMDLEDSVAAVDAEDKVQVYRTWLGLMKGDLVESFEKGGRTVERRLNPDRVYTAAEQRRASPAWAQPHAGAQCRPPHVYRCGAGRGRPGDPRDDPRRRRHLADRHSRSQSARAPSATAARARSIS